MNTIVPIAFGFFLIWLGRSIFRYPKRVYPLTMIDGLRSNSPTFRKKIHKLQSAFFIFGGVFAISFFLMFDLESMVGWAFAHLYQIPENSILQQLVIPFFQLLLVLLLLRISYILTLRLLPSKIELD